MAYRQSQGFSLVTILVLVLILSAASLGGWYVWQKNSTTPTKTTTTTSQKSTTQNKQPSTTDPSDGGKYVTVKEWNLRITLPDSLKGDISYFVNDRASKDSGGPVKIDFLSKKFSAGSLKCAVAEGDVPRSLVSIYKEVDGEGGVTQDPQPFKTIGNTRYYLTATPCEEAINRDGAAPDEQLLSDLKNAITITLENY